MGKPLRQQLGEWVVELAPVERLVPPLYVQWRPIVHDAMVFVVTMLSSKRLAPKIVEQLELPADTPAETRLLALITKVPGLQKIGQLLARNRSLDPRLRRALSRLENGISDVRFDEIRALIDAQLGPRLATYRVKIEPAMFSEASVSAVLRFTWRNPETGRRERGVFKVLKPYIPD
jgi:ubiquinone biosynthesis protein